MRTILLTLTLVFATSSVFAQLEKPACKKVADKFESLYNRGSYDKIFDMFSADMKQSLPLEQTREFLQGVKMQKGKIIKREFKKYLRTYAMYKTVFEKEVLALKISIDDNARINGLLINPYGD